MTREIKFTPKFAVNQVVLHIFRDEHQICIEEVIIKQINFIEDAGGKGRVYYQTVTTYDKSSINHTNSFERDLFLLEEMEGAVKVLLTQTNK